MSVYYAGSCNAFPYVVARYACRCGRLHTQHGAVQVRELPPGWHETVDPTGDVEPECADCHEKTLDRQRARA
jgi:hypothetical protein